MVVSMVDCNFARHYFCLAPCDSAARDQFRRRIATLLDGGCFYPAAFSWATPGLLFHDHVERVRALGGCRLGSNTTEITCCWCPCRRPRWLNIRCSSILFLLLSTFHVLKL